MAKPDGVTEIALDEILNQATDLAGRSIYANQARFVVGVNEVALDFYVLEPNTDQSIGKHQAQRVVRVLLPLSVAKDVSGLMLKAIEYWEGVFGVSLPLEPQEQLQQPPSEQEEKS